MFYDYIKHSANNRWPEILQSVAGLSKHQTTPTKTGMPCPYCGGTDRYEFKQIKDGFYMCRGCGAGDGWSMIMKILDVDFRQAVEQVARQLGIDRHAGKEYKRDLKCPKPDNTVRHNDIANKAQYIWSRSLKNPVEHPYLIHKCLPPLKLRQYKGNLVSPLYNQDFKLVNLQFIQLDKKKYFLKGGQTKGCFQFWGPLSWSVFVCEGVADAISTFLYNHQTKLTLSAYSVTNMGRVGQFLRNNLTGHRLVLVLDNDLSTYKRKYRPGMAALIAHNFFDDIILPPEGMDASDMWISSHE